MTTPPQAVLLPKTLHDKLAKLCVYLDDVTHGGGTGDVLLYETMLRDAELMNWVDKQRKAGVYVARSVKR